MITLPPKRGMALVVVLVLLAVMMLVTITLSGRMQQQLGRTRSQQEYQQALWYSASAESLALSALSLSLKNEKRVHLAQPWASGPRFFPLPQGQIAVDGVASARGTTTDCPDLAPRCACLSGRTDSRKPVGVY